MNHHPPKWLDRVLTWYCREERLEDLQGDLHEYFYRNLKKKGRRYASWVFFLDVIKFFRLYTIKPLKITRNMNFLSLWQNYVKTSIRSLSRNRLFTSINVIGLAISMSVGILMILLLTDLLSYDRFHTNRDNIYRLNAHLEESSSFSSDFASTSVMIGEKLRTEYPGVEHVVTIIDNGAMAVRKEDHFIQVSPYYASEDFFKLFSFDLIHGTPDQVLEDVSSIVLCKEVALKLFNRVDVVGEFVECEGESLRISGVFENVPINSHIQFEAIRPFSAYVVQEQANGNDKILRDWGFIWPFHTYFSLSPEEDPSGLQHYLDVLSAEENKKLEHRAITYYPQPLLEILPGKTLSNALGKQIDWEFIYILIGLVVIVLLSACFNYTNLSIARSLRRAKEVGVRKVVGASSGHVIWQFLTEAIIISVIAGVVSLGVFSLIKQPFLEILAEQETGLSNLQIGWLNVLYLLSFSLIIGIIAGVLPAFFLSRLKARSILKDASSIRLMKGVNLRKVLIVAQFALSIGFIMSTVIGYRQYKYLMNVNLGFNTDKIFNIDLMDADPDIVKNEIDKLAFVSSCSLSGMVVASGSIWTASVKYQDPLDSTDIDLNHVDHHYLPLHDFKFLAGENLPPYKKDSELRYAVVNEKLLERFQIGHPNDAIGQTIKVEGENFHIVGVVAEFQSLTAASAKRPFMFLSTGKSFHRLNVKLKADDLIAALGEMERVWQEIDPLHPMQGEFFDDQVARTYADMISTVKVVGFLAVLIITIASMGLLGMAVYTAETRMKEISIRKILGATERNLVFNLSKGFVWMMLIAASIAAPITYYIFDQHVLVSATNRISINFFDFTIGVVLVFLIGAVAIGWQTFKVARTNPATTLRDE